MPRKTPDPEHLSALYEELEEARVTFVDACDDLAAQLAPQLMAAAVALATWRKAADTFNEALYDMSADITEFCGQYSEKWQASDKGQAYESLGTAMEEAQIDTDPQEPLHLTLDFTSTPPIITVEDADQVLPETPEIPELDWQEP